MGAYDICWCTCIKCWTVTAIQTKLFENEMLSIREGTKLICPVDGSRRGNFILKLKEHCSGCDSEIQMIVKKGVVQTFVFGQSEFNDYFKRYYHITEQAFGEFVVDDGYTSKW